MRLFPSREYKSGTRWCLWRWTDVVTDHIVRLHIFKTPWNAVCLHWIQGPDPDPWEHDHPVSFLAIVLRGWYVETRNKIRFIFDDRNPPEEIRSMRRIVWWNWIRADQRDHHRIIACDQKTLTLCFMGPKKREWGFHTTDGWQVWRDYYANIGKKKT